MSFLDTLRMLTGRIAIFLCSFTAAIFIGDYFLVNEVYQGFAVNLRNVALIGSAFTGLIGIVNLTMYNVRLFQRKTPGRWYFSIWTLVLLYSLIILGVFFPDGPAYAWFAEYWYRVLEMGIYAITPLYLFSAAYRTFKVNSLESAVLLISTVFVVLGNAPAAQVFIYAGLPEIGTWILNKVGSVAYRGIYIGMAAGTVGLLIRTFLGKERGFMRGLVEEGEE